MNRKGHKEHNGYPATERSVSRSFVFFVTFVVPLFVAFVVPLFVTFVVPALPDGMVVLRAAGCDPEGEIRFVCGQAGPEDLVAVPGSGWLIASAYGARPSEILGAGNRRRTRVQPAPASKLYISPHGHTPARSLPP